MYDLIQGTAKPKVAGAGGLQGDGQAGAGGESRVDAQGNPIDQNGRLVLEKVGSINDLTDEDFSRPTRSVELPALSSSLNSLIPVNGRSVVIKKRVFEKNLTNHSELTAEQSRQILDRALYSTDLALNDRSANKPNYWILVKLGDRHAIVA